MQKRLNIALLFVTHDQIEALSLSNRIALMNFGVVQQGDPRLLYEQPVNEFVRDFVGKTLLFNERIEYQVEVDGQGLILIYGERHHPLEEGGKVWLKLRPDGHTAWASDWSPRAIDE